MRGALTPMTMTRSTVGQKGEVVADGEERLSLTTVAYNLIERQLILGEIAPGALLSEVSLSKTIGIGRTPVREALQRLARDRLITIVQRKGAIVSGFHVGQYMNSLVLRREVERDIVHTVAISASWNQRVALHALALRLRDAVASADLAEAVEIDWRFKAIELEVCDNAFLAAAVRPLHGVARRFYFAQAGSPVSQVALTEALLMEQVARGDAEASCEANDAFIDALEAFGRRAARRGKGVSADTTAGQDDEQTNVANFEVSLAEKAYELIEGRIVAGDYAVNELLSEGRISQELGLGRTPVREALQRLASNHLVMIVARRGHLVTDFDAYDLSRLIEARRPIERLLCRLAARNATGSVRAELARIVRSIKADSIAGGRLAMSLDQRVKSLLLKAAGNVFLADAISPIFGLSRAIYFRHKSMPDVDVARAQVSLLEAIIRADEAEAALGAIRYIAEVSRVMSRRQISRR